jgi:surfeit locus 1 family protein
MLMTTVMLLALLGLGSWQVQRLLWKSALLDQIARAEAAAPVPLPPEPREFTKVAATGKFLVGRSSTFGAEVRRMRTGVEMGAHLIEPLQLNNGSILLVDRGWVPQLPIQRIDQPEGVVTVTGYIRYGETAHWFSPGDEEMVRRFYTLDPEKIGAAAGFANVLPFVLVALGGISSPDGLVAQLPDPARQLPRPPNNHLSYAITWYGLAAALLAIFISWARKGPRA